MGAAQEIPSDHIGHLWLTSNTYRAVSRFGTIATLRAELNQWLKAGERPRQSSGREVQAALAAAERARDSSGGVDWDLYRRIRPVGCPGTGLYYDSGRLNTLPANDREKSIAALHLPARALHGLSKIGIHTIGELVELARAGTDQVPTAGPQTYQDIISSLAALADAAANGVLDWDAYAERRGVPLLPNDSRPEWTPLEFLAALPSTIRSAAEGHFGLVGSRVLEERLLQMASTAASLAHIGRTEGVTRERARAMEAAILTMFASAVRFDTYEGYYFRFRAAFLKPLRSLAASVVREGGTLLSNSEWDAVLRSSWGISSGDVSICERLILETLQVRIERDRPGTAERWSRQVEKLLVSGTVDLVSIKELQELLAGSEERSPTIEELRDILRALPSIELHRGTGCYRARTECLLRSGDRFERVLRDRNEPVRIRELCLAGAAVSDNTRFVMTRRAARARLAADPRFVAVGKSGLWALSEWSNVETRSIVDIAVEVIRAARNPVTSSALFEAVSRRRPVAQESIPKLLKLDGRVVKVGRSLWAMRPGL